MKPDMTITDPSLLKVLTAVFSSQRTMPAHFTSNGDRKQSFCIDYEIEADDEYELASHTHSVLWEYLGKITEDQISKAETGCVLKIGEDIALGAFILQKEDEYASFSDLKQELIEENVSLWDSMPQLAKVVEIPLVKNYFDFCEWFGRSRANGFRWGNQPIRIK